MVLVPSITSVGQELAVAFQRVGRANGCFHIDGREARACDGRRDAAALALARGAPRRRRETCDKAIVGWAEVKSVSY
jgi:hypothetical protein